MYVVVELAEGGWLAVFALKSKKKSIVSADKTKFQEINVHSRTVSRGRVCGGSC